MRWQVRIEVRQMQQWDTGIKRSRQRELYLKAVEGKNKESPRNGKKASMGEERKKVEAGEAGQGQTVLHGKDLRRPQLKCNEKPLKHLPWSHPLLPGQKQAFPSLNFSCTLFASFSWYQHILPRSMIICEYIPLHILQLLSTCIACCLQMLNKYLTGLAIYSLVINNSFTLNYPINNKPLFSYINLMV